MKYIFDLDDTLIDSTALNNDAYNYALEKYGYPRFDTNDRLTREELKFIPKIILDKIICEKQRYFTSRWLPYRIILNTELVEIVKGYEKDDCYIWTKASPRRVKPILEYCGLQKYFNQVIFDDKNSFHNSILTLQAITRAREFIIYEDNHRFFDNKRAKKIDFIQTDHFNVAGYLILG